MVEESGERKKKEEEKNYTKITNLEQGRKEKVGFQVKNQFILNQRVSNGINKSNKKRKQKRKEAQTKKKKETLIQREKIIQNTSPLSTSHQEPLQYLFILLEPPLR